MNKLKVSILTMLILLLQGQNAVSSELALHCTADPTRPHSGQLHIGLSDKHTTPQSGVAHLTSVHWNYHFSSARLICNTDLIQLKSVTTLDCVGFVFNGKIQVSGDVSQNGGQMKIHNIDADNAYADQTEGLVLNCKLTRSH